MAEVCGALGDAARAAELYALLEPYAGRNVVVGRNATYNGSASRLLGPAGRRARRVTTLAERHYEEAQEMHAPMGARPMARAHRRSSYAEMLLRAAAPDDVERAREMLADAILVADALGMVVLAERARDASSAGRAGAATVTGGRKWRPDRAGA